jgi:hypothetical protein
MDYVRYYFAVLFPVVAAIGFLIGGDAVWLGLALQRHGPAQDFEHVAG